LKSSDPLTDSASSVARDDKPQICVNIYESLEPISNNKKIYISTRRLRC
jgi:hypothetical protein